METLEEFAERLCPNKQVEYDMIIEGARWQQEISEEEVNSLFDTLKSNSIDNVVTITNVDLFINSWKKQLKKK